MMAAEERTRNRVAIAGLVSNAETGQVIHQARVEITKMPESFKNWLTLRAMQYGAKWQTMVERPDRTQTAIDGHFHFLNLPNGDYTLRVFAQGYPLASQSIQLKQGEMQTLKFELKK